MMIFFLVSFLSSIVGAICGIGGGVIIKPVLDMLQLESITTINFLSGCTVLSMSCYSVLRALQSADRQVDPRIGTPLALGAALGGLAGKEAFSAVANLLGTAAAGMTQSVCLGFVTLGTLVYTLNKARIATRCVRNKAVCIVIGLMLGMMSSFLGIGGGPINLVVLFYFFGMDTKTAASNSLYIILFSQIASLLATVVGGNIPDFRLVTLILMVCGGIGGGVVGRGLNKKLRASAVDILFIGLMVVIIGICIYNTFRSAML